jgi:Tfp pilus assembly protein PilN
VTAFATQVESVPLGGMPGWGIVADLTPPELITLRRVAVLRRRIVIGLLVVLAVVILGYAAALLGQHRASDEAAAANDETISLSQAAARYASITKAETTVALLNSQVAALMQGDVDVAAMLADIRAALPATMAISNISMTLGGDAPGSGTVGLDATGGTQIGTLTLSGTGRSLDDLPAFVDRLSRVKGMVDVLPTSNTLVKGTAEFNVTASLTDALYTHRYDASHSESAGAK